MVKYTIYGQISETCTGTGVEQPSRTEPVHVQLWYSCGIASRTEPVPVQVRAIPVQVVLCFSDIPVFVI